MFFGYVKNQWLNGNVSVGLPADGDDEKVQFSSTGLTQLALLFLNESERQDLVKLAKDDAKRSKDSFTGKGEKKAVNVRGSHGYEPVPELIDAVKQACVEYYSEYQIHGLYLVGSRAKGRGREFSDHDFVIVLSDNTPDEIVKDNGLYGHLGVSYVRKATAGIIPGAKSPDLIICRLSDFSHRCNDVQGKGFPYLATHEGVKII